MHAGCIFYDANGVNPPNQWGHDLFVFIITLDQKKLKAGNGDMYAGCYNANAGGHACAEWIIVNDNMDYLK